jgi:hypothetical protein
VATVEKFPGTITPEKKIGGVDTDHNDTTTTTTITSGTVDDDDDNSNSILSSIHKNKKVYDDRLGPSGFRDILDNSSNTLQKINKKLGKNDSNSNSNNYRKSYHRFSMSLKSTLNVQSLFSISCIQIFQEVIGNYLNQFTTWVLSGGPRNDQKLYDAFSVCLFDFLNGQEKDININIAKESETFMIYIYIYIIIILHTICLFIN